LSDDAAALAFACEIVRDLAHGNRIYPTRATCKVVAFTAVRKLEPNPRLAYMLMFLTIAVSAKRKLSVRRSSFVLKQSRNLLLVADG
jgi:hypothetical protein